MYDAVKNMCIVGKTKIKCYHSRKTGTINVNGFIGVVTRKQYFASIVLTIIKKKQIVITSHHL